MQKIKFSVNARQVKIGARGERIDVSSTFLRIVIIVVCVVEKLPG